MKKVLVCRTGAFGDICMALPLVHALAAECDVHWLIRSNHAALLALFPEVICQPVCVDPEQGGRIPAGLVSTLAAAHYDALLDLSNWDLVASVARRLKSIPVRAVAYDATRIQPFQRLRNALPWRKPFNRIVRIDRKVHRVVKWQELMRASLGCTLSINWPLPPAQSLDGDIRLFVHPHASKASKRWSIDDFATAITGLAEHRITHCFINEGHSVEREASAELGSRLRHAGLAVTMVPFDSSLIGLRNALAHAHVAVGPDSGPMHFASLLGVPTVVIFGPYSPAEVGPLWRSIAVTPPDGRGRTSEVTPAMVSKALVEAVRRPWDEG